MDTHLQAFKQTQRVADEAFDSRNSASAHLYISFGAHRLRMGVLDAHRNKFVYLEDYESDRPMAVEHAVEVLKEIIKENPLLKARNWSQVRLGIKNQHFTLIPESLFDVNAREEYLNLNAEVEPNQETIFHYAHPRLELINVFAVPAKLKKWATTYFEDSRVEFVHQTSALMEGFLHMADATSLRLNIYVDKNYVTLVVLNGNKLEFCNSFYYTTAEDFIYYVLFVLQEKKMNPDQDTVMVWGELLLDSELHDVLRKYIRNLKFGKRPTNMGFSYRFDTIFEHRNFDLYSLPLCD